MNNPNENQHFVSTVLLKRFKISGNALQCYQVQAGNWISKNPDKACASPGYNQLMFSGQTEAENKLEAEFSAVESRLPKLFKALEAAATRPTTELAEEIYNDLCKYCAFLKLVAPHAKPGAVAAFLFQLNWELERQEKSLLRDLQIPEETIIAWSNECKLGKRVIIESDNALQLLYRFQFNRLFQFNVADLKAAHWTIFNSSIELPISDVGVVPIGFSDLRVNAYLLPLSPNLLLRGLFYFDREKRSTTRNIKSRLLTKEEAELFFDCICSSAVTEIVCSGVNADVPKAIQRAKSNGIKFHKITNPKEVLTAGLKSTNVDYLFKVVSVDEYKRVVYSFMQPAD